MINLHLANNTIITNLSLNLQRAGAIGFWWKLMLCSGCYSRTGCLLSVQSEPWPSGDRNLSSLITYSAPPRSPLSCKNKLNLYHIELFHIHALQLAISFIFLSSFPFQPPPHLVDLWSEEGLWHPPRGPDAGSCDCLPPLWRCPPVTTATSASWLTCHDIRDLPPPFALPVLFLIPSSFPL